MCHRLFKCQPDWLERSLFQNHAFFLSLAWLTLNQLDQAAEDYPLVKIKYTYLLWITPLVVLDAFLQYRYFAGLEPNIIVSCCGALFNDTDSGVATTLTVPPIKLMMILFFTSLAGLLVSSALSLVWQKKGYYYLTTGLACLLLPLSLLAIISFVSLYYYQLPTHHCPFDLLQGGYHFIGYPLYITLFSSLFFLMMSGILVPFAKVASIRAAVAKRQQQGVWYGMVLLLLFAALVLYPMLFSDFTLEGFY